MTVGRDTKRNKTQDPLMKTCHLSPTPAESPVIKRPNWVWESMKDVAAAAIIADKIKPAIVTTMVRIIWFSVPIGFVSSTPRNTTMLND